MLTNQTVVFAGGGTGGHLFPGIAVAEALRAAHADIKPLFLCTTREIDRLILEPTGLAFMEQPIVPPQRSIGGLLRFWRSWRGTREMVKRMLDERRPAVVVGLGGYAAGVAVKLAAERRIPTAIINPDVIPGRANRYLMRHVAKVFCQFPQTSRYVSAGYGAKLVVTGCPIRRELRHLPERSVAAAALGLESHLLTLVITGASQGAQTVNEAMLAVLPRLKLQGWQVLHLAGRDHAAAVSREYHRLGIGARVIDFTPRMEQVWAVADLAVCRAGASTCAELTACGVPAILMPYPYHRDMHQRANALALAEAGAAIHVEDMKDAQRNAAALHPLLESLLRDAGRREAMAKAARAMGHPDAADRVAEALGSLA